MVAKSKEHANRACSPWLSLTRSFTMIRCYLARLEINGKSISNGVPNRFNFVQFS